MWIYGAIMQSLLTMILKKGASAKSVWQSLEELFRDNKDARAIELDNELRSMVLGDRSISEYCQKMKLLYDLLANIDAPVPKKTLVSYLINGLSPRLDNITTVLHHRGPLPTFLQACSILLLEEQRLSRARPQQPAHSDHASSPSVLHTVSSPSTS